MRIARLLCIPLMVTACAGSGERSGPGEGGEMPEDLAASLEVEVAESSVRLVLHVTNTGTRPMEFVFPTSQRFDFEVVTPDGEGVWRWSEGMAFLQVLSRATLQPAESWDMEAVWEPGDRSGRFEAVGRLTARSHGLEQRAAFELP